MNLISFDRTTPPRRQQASSSTCFHGHLDLSLGISLSHGRCDGTGAGCDGTGAGCDGTGAGCDGKAGHGSARGGDDGCVSNGVAPRMLPLAAGRDVVAGAWTFMPSPTGFMHPWSLAARQQKAAAEQDRGVAGASTYPARDARIVPLPAAVGWPPVHTSRRNLVGVQVPKPVVSDGSKDTERVQKAPPCNMTATSNTMSDTRTYMFAKVHMEGYMIGRKINLRAHGSYASLSRVLTRMTKHFFCPADSSRDSGEPDAGAAEEGFIFLYEDFEGDRMLVGDVPWELFLASAKRLYIARNPASQDKGDEGVTKDIVPEETTK